MANTTRFLMGDWNVPVESIEGIDQYSGERLRARGFHTAYDLVLALVREYYHGGGLSGFKLWLEAEIRMSEADSETCTDCLNRWRYTHYESRYGSRSSSCCTML